MLLKIIKDILDHLTLTPIGPKPQLLVHSHSLLTLLGETHAQAPTITHPNNQFHNET